jgi:hypothetical protein
LAFLPCLPACLPVDAFFSSACVVSGVVRFGLIADERQDLTW